MTDLTFAGSSAGHAGQDRWLRIQRVFMGQCSGFALVAACLAHHITLAHIVRRVNGVLARIMRFYVV